MSDNPWDIGGEANADNPRLTKAAPVAQAPTRLAAAPMAEPPPEAPGTPARTQAPSPATTATAPEQMTPVQRRTFDELLAIGADRPVMRPGLVEELEARIIRGTADAIDSWTEPSVYLSKGPLFSTLRCEGLVLADESSPRDFSGMHPKTAVGIVAHRAIQTAHVTPGHPSAHYVAWALEATLRGEERMRDFWEAEDPGSQADMTMQMVSKVNYYLSSFPALDALWDPRFEESVAARAGKLRMGAKLDLVLGNPKASGRQTMLLCDLKTGQLGDHHYDEASFCALVSTLRHRVAPFRSMVYSLPEGEWTDPEVTEDRLIDIADKVIHATVTRIQLLTEQRTPNLTSGSHCTYCPLRETCPESATREQQVAA